MMYYRLQNFSLTFLDYYILNVFKSACLLLCASITNPTPFIYSDKLATLLLHSCQIFHSFIGKSPRHA